jgi:hypothetical protein
MISELQIKYSQNRETYMQGILVWGENKKKIKKELNIQWVPESASYCSGNVVLHLIFMPVLRDRLLSLFHRR